jgi:hypothetical protein
LVKYQAHINVEIVNRDGMEKYLFKYSTKGPDYAKVGIRDGANEIQQYLECRCVTPCEAAWRLLQFDIHHTDPSMERLPVHLPLENSVVFSEDDHLDQVIENPRSTITKLTAWFDANRIYPHARQHTYVEFPEFWTWHGDGKYWKQRSQSHKGKVGRIANVGPNQGEQFYLRILLHVVKGAQSFSDVRTVSGIQYPTFQSACEAMGLLGDDREWSHAITDAAQWALPYQLRQLFVMMLLFCQVSDPAKLFDNNVQLMGEDFAYRVCQQTPRIHQNILQEHIRLSTLAELDRLLRDVGYSLDHFQLPRLSHLAFPPLESRLIMDELAYGTTEVTELLNQLNPYQRHVYTAIESSVLNNSRQTFFVYGYGGTGKTFLWNTLLDSIRNKGKIAVAVASSGIAALLLPGGRTPHSCFRIPLDIQDDSMCAIKKNTHLAEFIQQTSLIIWDEAPVNHKHCFEAFDRTLRDIMSSINQDSVSMQFGGITVVLGGDFRKTLPIIPNARKQQILNASITRSHLWKIVWCFN